VAATIEWLVESLDCYPTKDGKTDVVMSVHWRCNGAEEKPREEEEEGEEGEEEKEKEYFRSTFYGTVSVTYQDGDDFTPFADLTKDQVLGWVWESVDKNETETKIQKGIDDQRNPPITQPTLPWA
tara:strand:- start:228 stop:602 length:375 start_codon:yes stop_codon:yes gene_type:complete